MLLAVLR